MGLDAPNSARRKRSRGRRRARSRPDAALAPDDEATRRPVRGDRQSGLGSRGRIRISGIRTREFALITRHTRPPRLGRRGGPGEQVRRDRCAGSPGLRGAGFESSHGRRARRFSTSTAQSRDPTSSRMASCTPSRTAFAARSSGALLPAQVSCTSSRTRLTARRSTLSSLAISAVCPRPRRLCVMAATVRPTRIQEHLRHARELSPSSNPTGFDVVLVTGSIDFLARRRRDPLTEVTLKHARRRKTVGSRARSSEPPPTRRNARGCRTRGEARRGSRGVARVRRFTAEAPMLSARPGILQRRHWPAKPAEPRRRDADGTSSAGPWTKTCARTSCGRGVSDSHGVNKGRR